MNNIIDLPYFSQLRDIEAEEWKRRGCGVAVIAMVVNYYRPEAIQYLDHLIDEANAIRPFTERGWAHDVLVLLAHNYSVLGYREEFKTISDEHQIYFRDAGIEKIAREVTAGRPVIISTVRKFNEEDKFHMVVITGVKQVGEMIEGFYYSDPDYATEKEGKDQYVDLLTFKKFWRRMAIFLRGKEE